MNPHSRLIKLIDVLQGCNVKIHTTLTMQNCSSFCVLTDIRILWPRLSQCQALAAVERSNSGCNGWRVDHRKPGVLSDCGEMASIAGSSPCCAFESGPWFARSITGIFFRKRTAGKITLFRLKRPSMSCYMCCWCHMDIWVTQKYSVKLASGSFQPFNQYDTCKVTLW